MALRWYSLLLFAGLGYGYLFMQALFRREHKPARALEPLLVYVVLGMLIGARLGHCLLYEPALFLADPARVWRVWEGGLASHGGFAGVLAALALYCRRRPDFQVLWLADRLSLPAMVVAGLIRIGNFCNSEIYGRPTDLPWGVVFTRVDMLPRHPTQLYEAAAYLLIATLLYAVYRRENGAPRPGLMLGLACALGFGLRLVVEILKENQVPFEAHLPLNMGQLLSLPFLVLGLALIASDRLRPHLADLKRRRPSRREP